MTTDERQERTDQAYADGVAATQQMSVSLGKKPSRGQVWKIGFVLSCLVLGVSLLLGAAAAKSVVELKASQLAAEEARKTENEATSKAIKSLQEDNAKLQSRGQQPIQQPVDPNPSDALVAAATARVLANLPPAPLPTDDQIGRALAAYFALNPVSVSPQWVAQQVSNYFVENPVEPGEPGEKGDEGEPGKPGVDGKDGKDGVDGHTPTPDEIMAVFNAAAASNPNILCAGKGTFTEVVGFVRVPPENLPSERHFWTCLPTG
jgi:hypothetical protein